MNVFIHTYIYIYMYIYMEVYPKWVSEDSLSDLNSLNFNTQPLITLMDLSLILSYISSIPVDLESRTN